jgi:hypothetical protein
MIRLLYNGKEITHGTVTIITGDDKSEPPKDDRPPVRKPTKPPASKGELGVLQKGFNSREVNLLRDDVLSLGFSLPADTKLPYLFFQAAPQNSSPATLKMWISTTPGGKPIGGGMWGMWTAQAEDKAARINSQIGVSVAVKGNAKSLRKASINTAEPYYFNLLATKGPRDVRLLLNLDGAFK